MLTRNLLVSALLLSCGLSSAFSTEVDGGGMEMIRTKPQPGLSLVPSSQGVRSESQEKERALRLAKLDEETAASRVRRAQHEAAEARAIQSIAPTAFVGQVVWSAGLRPPSGQVFLPCDGRLASRTGYADLFAVIGTLYGQGDGVTTFNVPDLRGRTTASYDVTGGSGTAGRLPATPFSGVGGTGGAATHTLTIAEMPAHSHSTLLPTFVGLGAGPITARAGEPPTLAAQSSDTGGNAPHSIVQPTILLQAFICAQGGTFYKHAKELHREAAIGEETEDQATCCSSFSRWLFGRRLTDKLPLSD